MIAATFTQAGVGLIVAVPSLVVAWFGYRHSQRVDANVMQAGIATREATSIGQVIDGQNKLIESLQDDNAVLRERVKDLNTRLNQIIRECESLQKDNVALRTHVADLHTKLDLIIRECEDLRRQVNSLDQKINHDPPPSR